MVSYGITHESGRLERVLVHHPGAELNEANRDPVKHHFEKPVNINRFILEHKRLMESLREAGVEVLNIREIVGEIMGEAIEKCPNLVFTRDSSSVTNAGAIIMRMGLPSRRLETPIIKAVYKTIGVPVGIQLEEPETFEGGGFALLEDRVAVAGLCSRTTRRALELIRDFLFREQLVDLFIILNLPEGEIHIDGDFVELPGKLALVHTGTLEYALAEFYKGSDMWSGSFIEWLKEEGWQTLEITDKERLDMAANFLTIDRDLAIHYEGNPRVIKEVRSRGIEVIQIPGSEMKKGNGGIHCMTCPILRT